MKELLQVIFSVLIIFAVIISAFVAIDYSSCNRFIRLNPDYETRYEYPFLGCMVKIDGLWISTIQLVVHK